LASPLPPAPDGIKKSGAEVEQTKREIVSRAAPVSLSSRPHSHISVLGMSAAGRLLGGRLVSNAKRKTDRKVVKPGGTAPEGDVGQALRAAYDRTVGESVPQEMLDLLGKLK
jgi:hypothetical protein